MATIEQELQDLKIGDTLLVPLQFLNNADDTPIAQAGNHYTMTLKQDKSVPDADSDLLINLVVPASADADNGIITFRADASETLQLSPSTYKYEIKQIIPDTPENTVATLFEGTIKLRH